MYSRSLLLAAYVLFIYSTFFAHTTQAAPTSEFVYTTHDLAYNMSTNVYFDDNGLPLSRDALSGQTDVAYFQLDLSSISLSAITEARLYFYAVHGSVASCYVGLITQDVGFGVYGVNNDAWTEASPPANELAVSTMLLGTVDQGVVTSTGSYYITDNSNGPLAAWLNNQLATNGGNNLATLRVQIEGPTLNPVENLLLEDRERSLFNTYSCPISNSALVQALEVGNSMEPLAIQLIGESARTDRRGVAIASLLMILSIGTIAVVLQKRLA